MVFDQHAAGVRIADVQHQIDVDRRLLQRRRRYFYLRHRQESNGLKQTYELQLRSLSEPHHVYNELFESRVEFSRAAFGKPHLSFQMICISACANSSLSIRLITALRL